LFVARLALATALLTIVTYLAAFAQTYQEFIPIWPGSGIGLALIWRHGLRYWPAVFVSSTLLSMAIGTGLFAAAGNGALEVLITLMALYLLARWQVQRSIADLRQLFRFVLAVVLASALAIPIYGLRMAIVFEFAPMRAFGFGAEYFLSEVFSLLIFTPLLVAWSGNEFASGRRRWLFAGSIAVLALAGCVVPIVEPSMQDRFLFSLLPLVIFCALGAGVGGASAGATVLSFVLIGMAQASATIADTLLRSAFVLSAALTGYLLAVMFRERERAARQMEFRAHHDALTGLINRFEFENRVNRALRTATVPHALLYLDLDQFKLINDTCGHLAGDDMLRRLATTIARTLPADATLARLGGDEFGCLLPQATPERVDAIARRLHDDVRAFEFLIGELRFTVGVSIGTTFLSPGADRGSDDVLARADVACYAAKDAGRNRTYAYAEADAGLHGRHSDIQKISQLQSELSHGLFQLYGQRIVAIDGASDEELYEVLLRHADPNSAWPIENVFQSAQRYGMTAKVDRWVLEESAKFLRDHAGTNVRLSVNVAATTLESDGFRDFVLELPARFGFSMAQVQLEITETVAVQNLTRAVETLRAFRANGLGICLDDFGAGVASFGYLSDLPVTGVKIDGRFVRDLIQRTSPTAEIVIESLARIARLRGLHCVAEWVEDIAVIAKLRDLGVTAAQGYAIQRPGPLASIRLAPAAIFPAVPRTNPVSAYAG